MVHFSTPNELTNKIYAKSIPIFKANREIGLLQKNLQNMSDE
jgi:hypothetical protein